MAVMRMTLDDSQFQTSNTSITPKTTPQPLAPLRNPVVSAILPVKKKSMSIMPFIAIVAIVGVIFFVGNKIVQKTRSVLGSNTTLLSALKPKLQQDADGRTNVLLIGIDTREAGEVQRNTDTIILGSYDSNTNRFAMVSFPRDLAVYYPGKTELSRINSIYAIGENSKKGIGVDKLKEVVETISGKTIQYTAMIDLKGFTDAIDVVGGVDVYLENDLSGLYPNEDFSYDRVTFTHGWTHMDGTMALQYSRIRKEVVPASEGSDFGRARRQQKVIQALIDKVSKSETLLDPKKVLNLTTTVFKNLTLSKFGIGDIEAGINIIKDKGKPTSYTSVLDLYAGGDLARLIDVINTNPYLLGPRLGAGKYSEIKNYINSYFTEPMLVTMTKQVLIYTGGDTTANQKSTAFIKKYYFATTKVSSQSGPGIGAKGFVYPVGGKLYEQVSKTVAAELGLEYKSELPEELKSVDTAQYGVVAVF